MFTFQVSDTAFETIPLPFFGGYSSASDWSDTVLLDARIKNINNNVADGRVVLLHDVALNVDALEATLPALRFSTKNLISKKIYAPQKYLTFVVHIFISVFIKLF